MNEASNQRETMEKQPGTPAHPSACVVSPVWRVSPKYNGSTLYDSFELQAVTKQLNRALLGSNNDPLSPYSHYLNSPFYRQRLGRIYRENAKTPKRIASRPRGVDRDAKAGGGGARGTVAGAGAEGFLTRLWNKVKRGLLWNNKQ